MGCMRTPSRLTERLLAGTPPRLDLQTLTLESKANHD